ncbi:CDP-alcohol phosphatidyltransferase family protein [Oscillatoria sp. FACHB-1406]|uniref:CDP-alcohol phosphatidyltransferase family protein n=1 Tax=Oscillatoria sp. FACHB-1406 TaxID=2692846 RepID=UPI00168A0907|nr:CDP-alcohol phosphatidyltransferase family protein [Oscillatoria sp. FACHB-1406]MBD2578304.1 CDP-alcohol phosphatidyltransferase family protein [Oscillatoria sp. FACHB-1406]
MLAELTKLLPYLPTSLVLLRFCLAPVLLADAFDGNTSQLFIVAFVAAFLSDIFDGVIARRLDVSTAKLRQADSWADVALYACVSASALLVRPDAIAVFRIPLLTVVFVQLWWWVANLLKYGKPASYHTYSAKLWGLSLFIAAIALFGFHYSGVTLWLAIIIGILHTLEEIAMTSILPVWTHDVLSFKHALQLRQMQLN